MIQLDIISDPICPWCYIGKAHLDRAVAETGVNPFDINWRPFQLNPDMPAEGMDRRSYLEAKFGGPDKSREVYRRIEAAAAEAGVEVDFDLIGRTPNTMDAHRLIRWAKPCGVQSMLVDQLFVRYFQRGEDISEHGTLLVAAEAAGMERGVVAQLLVGDADLADIREEEFAARKMGVNGVPCFIVGGRYVLQGAQGSQTWADVIRELVAAQETRQEAQP